jgi:hypothetical protein
VALISVLRRLLTTFNADAIGTIHVLRAPLSVNDPRAPLIMVQDEVYENINNKVFTLEHTL